MLIENICPAIKGLQKMTSICNGFAIEYDVVFNPGKTPCTVFDNRPMCPDRYLYLSVNKLEWTAISKHLRNITTTDQKDDPDIQLKFLEYFLQTIRNLGK